MSVQTDIHHVNKLLSDAEDVIIKNRIKPKEYNKTKVIDLIWKARNILDQVHYDLHQTDQEDW